MTGNNDVRGLHESLTLPILMALAVASISACSVRDSAVDQKSAAIADVVAGPSPHAVPANPTAPTRDHPVLLLRNDYGQRQKAELVQSLAKRATPAPFLAKLASYKVPDLTSTLAVVQVLDGATESVSNNVVERTLQVERTIAGTTLGATINVRSEGYAESMNSCALFQPRVGVRYAVLLQPGSEAGTFTLVERDDWRGWFLETQPGVFRIDRGPSVTEAQLTSSLTGEMP